MSSASSVQSSSPSLQFIPLGKLGESPTNPRKHFDAAKLEELSRSIKEVGVLEPLIVRAHANGNVTAFQIVCGARRYRASKLAGLSEVPATVRDFTDDQVRLIQLAENGAREDLSPIDEAEAYAALAADGLDSAAIAKALGKKKGDVARRLPLAKLPKNVKDALASGLLPVSHGEYLARIPDGKLLEEAFDRFFYDANDGEGKPIMAAVPLAVAKRIVEEEFMTSLSLAIFDPEDATLSPLGACSKCPHLAGNNPDLFGDVKAKAVCTNPRDFRLKIENHLAKLRDSGCTVLLSKNELKRAFPCAASSEPGREFVDLERMCLDDPKRRTYEELLGRGEKLKMVFAFKDGRVRKLYPAKVIREALVASGHSFAKEKRPRPANGQDAARSAARLEQIGDAAVSRELAVRLRSMKLAPGGWIDLLLQIAILLQDWRVEEVIRRHGFEGTTEEFKKNRGRIISDAIAAMTDADKRAFLVDLLLGGWIRTINKPEQELYRHVLKLAGVNYAKVTNAAIDAAKKKAAESKKTTKPPIAAKTVRAPQAEVSKQRSH
jgi:ParB/RepB/Spo0J family partition protein